MNALNISEESQNFYNSLLVMKKNLYGKSISLNDLRKSMILYAKKTINEQIQGEYNIVDEQINHIPIISISPKTIENPDKVIIYLHGGAYRVGGPFYPIPVKLALASNVKVISVDYSLAPEKTYPPCT